jgi:hypothetical protein
MPATAGGTAIAAVLHIDYANAGRCNPAPHGRDAKRQGVDLGFGEAVLGRTAFTKVGEWISQKEISVYGSCHCGGGDRPAGV